jgi:hypothetical protein
MFGIVASALWSVVGFLLTQVVVKFVMFFAVYLLCGEMADMTASLITGDANSPLAVLNLFNGLPEGALYFMDMFYVVEGVKGVLAAMVTMFALRRIPFFGR